MKKVLSIIMIIAMVFCIATPAVVAADEKTNNVYVSATTDNTIKIKKAEEYVEPDYNGNLILSSNTFNIERDYAQLCKISVKNTSDNPIKYYLRADNKYDDIYLNFVRSGSEDDPLIIEPNESQEVTLDIFAQNAKLNEYQITIYAVTEDDDSDAKCTITLKCPEVSMNFSLTQTKENENSLSKTFVLKNLGVSLTDVTVYAEGDIADYTGFSPAISNYPMNTNANIEFSAKPDLNKMKKNNISVISGSIVVAAGGKTQKFDVTFDTKGQEIISITLGELAAMQSGVSTQNYLKTNGALGKVSTSTKVLTSQCTNAGKNESKFHFGDFDYITGNSLVTNGLDLSTVELYVTNRMYGGEGVNRWYNSTDPNYIDIEDTNYTYYLNGKTCGSGFSSGVTDLAIAKLDASNLKQGATNTLICDYDTNPGHYFVTADTEITILIPDDIRICYIGSPKGLEDVRSLPDFAIYSENIFPTKDVVYLGESTGISFKVYNRGSEDGTFDISVSDGTNVIYTESEHKLDAFSGDTISFNWTPETETNSITVSLTNKTDLDEKDIENNTASKEIIVAERKVPVITSFPNVSTQYGETFTLNADIQNTFDIEEVSFYIDDKLVSSTTDGVKTSNGKRYSVDVSDKIKSGDHKTKVIVTYVETADNDGKVEKLGSLTVGEKNWSIPEITSFSVPEKSVFGSSISSRVYLNNTEDIASVTFIVDGKNSFAAYKSGSSYYTYLNNLAAGDHKVIAEIKYYINEDNETATLYSEEKSLKIYSVEECTYQFEIDKELTNGITAKAYKYYSDSKYDYSSTSVSLSKISESETKSTYQFTCSVDMIENKDLYVLNIMTNNALLNAKLSDTGVSFTKEKCKSLTFLKNADIKIYELTTDSVNEKYMYLYRYYDFETLYCTPGTYELSIYYYLFNNYTSKDVTVDLTDSNQTVDLTAGIIPIKFSFDDNEQVLQNYSFTCYDDDNNSYYLDGIPKYDSDSKTYTFYVSEEYYVDILENSSIINYSVSTQDAYYKGSVKDISSLIVLKKSDLNKIEFVPENKDLFDISRMAFEKDIYSEFASNVIYLPNGEYECMVLCEYSNGKNLVQTVDFAVENENKVVTVGGDFAKINLSWKDAFNSIANINAMGDSAKTMIYSEVENNSYLLAPKDKYDTTVYLYRNNSEYIIKSTIDCLDKDFNLEIDNSFIGKITNTFSSNAYSGKGNCYIYLSDFVDKNGNVLNSFDSYNSDDNLTGYIILTNVNDKNDVHKVEVSTSRLYSGYSLWFELPNVDGEYNIAIELATDNELIETERLLPEVNVFYDEKEVLYACSELPEIKLGDGSTEGTIKWKSTELKPGTNDYVWEFVPDDTETYKTVTGTVSLTVKDEHCFGEWISNNDSKFFCEGTKTRTCSICGYEETQIDEGSAEYHNFISQHKCNWFTVAAFTVIALIITRIVLHFTFWYIPLF